MTLLYRIFCIQLFQADEINNCDNSNNGSENKEQYDTSTKPDKSIFISIFK